MVLAVRDHIPLKQGLRLQTSICIEHTDKVVRDHIPLKQGLRQREQWSINVIDVRPRPYSIRTRIKTRIRHEQLRANREVRPIFH